MHAVFYRVDVLFRQKIAFRALYAPSSVSLTTLKILILWLFFHKQISLSTRLIFWKIIHLFLAETHKLTTDGEQFLNV